MKDIIKKYKKQLKFVLIFSILLLIYSLPKIYNHILYLRLEEVHSYASPNGDWDKHLKRDSKSMFLIDNEIYILEQPYRRSSKEKLKLFNIKTTDDYAEIDGLDPKIFNNKIFSIIYTETDLEDSYSINILSTDFITQQTQQLNTLPILLKSNYFLIEDIRCWDLTKEVCNLVASSHPPEKEGRLHHIITNDTNNIYADDIKLKIYTLFLPDKEGYHSYHPEFFYAFGHWNVALFNESPTIPQIYELNLKDDKFTLGEEITLTSNSLFSSEAEYTNLSISTHSDHIRLTAKRESTIDSYPAIEEEYIKIYAEPEWHIETELNFNILSEEEEELRHQLYFDTTRGYAWINDDLEIHFSPNNAPVTFPNIGSILDIAWVHSPDVVETNYYYYLLYHFDDHQGGEEGYKVYRMKK